MISTATTITRAASCLSPLSALMSNGVSTTAASFGLRGASSQLSSSYTSHKPETRPRTNIAETLRNYSTFEPPTNNAYHGTPVYKGIDISANDTISSAASARNNDPEAVFVVTGASRSMGLQFVMELLSRTKGRIVACVLRPGNAPALDSFLRGISQDERSRIEVHRLDVTDQTQIQQLSQDLTDAYGRVDGLFNVA
eukprot:CAMPEP_0201669900 /NCGR_PEP_ID=MMETSP0494-20130426/25159_1 /ASSEMBLY_ACC=CAM_ASM_000839 /TAXON_ID=420259 /ORGANISM="Thalassiosira gravida, Strain GMp14c1" /LENGTH=196 /DNA_ID=CAMNT_0048150789 /DNA_START=72 /DNA_END=658 /DNA_ORIENTATION=+